MTSKSPPSPTTLAKPLAYDEAYVWVWLPQATAPVVAGRLSVQRDLLLFNYGKSYLARENAIPLYLPDLPLQAGALPLPHGATMPRSIRDAAPDAWGRRIILNRMLGTESDISDNSVRAELTFLLESDFDRIGALDFQRSPVDYIVRTSAETTLAELLDSARRVEEGIPLAPELGQALHHGSSIGGARPKVLIDEGEVKYVAKFPSISDVRNVIKAEYIAMRLACLCGLDVAPVSLTSALGKDVLLVERFDRSRATDGNGDGKDNSNSSGWRRRMMVSALTILELDEMTARYARYTDFAEKIRYRFTNVPATLREMFARLVFNILCGNTDDHARNHAAFWDGAMLSLTPAYDICPQTRTGQEASQAMLIGGDNNLSRLATCLAVAPHFHLSDSKATAIIEAQLQCIAENWHSVCTEAKLSEVDEKQLWGRAFLNPYAFTALEGEHAQLAKLGEDIRTAVSK